MVEGFVKPIIGMSLEEASLSCVEELVRRSLIQVFTHFDDGTGKENFCLA